MSLIKSIQEDLPTIQDRFIKLTNKETFEKEASFAIQHIHKSLQLQKCTKASLLASVLNVANFGLTLNPIKKEAYLVPRYDRTHGFVAHLEPSYQGLIKAVIELGGVNSVYAHPVFEGDEFDVSLGTETEITHKPKFESKNIIKAYAVAILDNGTKQIEVMGIEELNEIRDTSESYKAFRNGKIRSCVWDQWPSEMYRKTVIRRLVKYLPKANNERLSNLVVNDETDFKPTYEEIMYAEGLIKTSTYDHEKQAYLEKIIFDVSKPELQNIVIDLQNNQLPVTEVYAPTQKELANSIKDKE